MCYNLSLAKVTEQPKRFMPQPAKHDKWFTSQKVSHPLMVGLLDRRRRRNEEHRPRIPRQTQKEGMTTTWQSAARRGLNLGPAQKRGNHPGVCVRGTGTERGWIRRFEMGVEQLKSREADDLWVSLGNCDIQDGKIASLTEALTQNATVTAVDLSRNSITASGAQVCARKS